MTYHATGKQILRGKTHIADAATEAWASRIAALLNLPDWLDRRADKCRSRWGARIYRIVADDLWARLHEGDS